MESSSPEQDELERQASLEKLNLLGTGAEERFERTVQMVSRLLNAPICAFSLLDEDRQWCKAVHGLEALEPYRENSFCAHTIANPGPFVVENTLRDDRFKDNPLVQSPAGIRFFAGYPVTSPEGLKIGALCVLDQTPRKATDSMLEDLKALADLLEKEIDRRKLNPVLLKMVEAIGKPERKNLIDPLTRLWNAKGGDEFLNRLEASALQSRSKFAVVVLDIDHFDKINQAFGQTAGDQVLKEASKRILKKVRSEDFCCRMENDAFMAVIDNVLPKEVMEVTRRLWHEFHARPFEAEGQKIVAKASLGAAYFEPDFTKEGGETTRRLALEALQRAKNTGGDRIVSHFGRGFV